MLLEHNKKVYGELENTLSESEKAIVIMGTGVGKTYVTKEYIENHSKHPLIVCPRTSICKSWAGKVKGSTAITYQKLAKNYRQIDFSQYDLIVYDESHHLGARTWSEAFDYIAGKYGIKTIGLTADSVRYTDGCVDVGERFFDGNFCYGESISSAIEKEILNPIKYVGAFYDTNGIKDAIKGKATNRLYAKLDLAINKTPTVEEIIKSNIGKGRKKGIIFAPSIGDMDNAISFVSKTMPGYEFRKISSRMPDSENNANLEWFEKAKEGFLCSVNMVSEGVHIDGVNMLVMLRRTTSPTLFIQQLGRCLSSNGRQRAVVFDFVNNKFNVGTMAHKARAEKSMIEETSEMLSAVSKQLIIRDYTKDIVSVLGEIKESLGNKGLSWTDEEIAILVENYPKMGRECAKLLNGRSAQSIICKANDLGIKFDNADLWTEEELSILRENYPKLGNKCYGMIPNRTPSSVRTKIQSLGLKSENADDKWTDDEDAVIMKNAKTMSYAEIASMLPGRSHMSVKQRARALGMCKDVPGKWTDEEKETIRTMWGNSSVDEIASVLGRPREGVRFRIRKMGLPSKYKQIPWTEEDTVALKEMFGKYSTKEISEKLGHTEDGIRGKLRKLGLTSRKK